MLDRLCEECNMDFDTLLRRCGIDENDLLQDEEVLRLLDLYVE